MASMEEYLFQAMSVIAQSMPKSFDVTKIGRITAVLNNNRYKVQILDDVYTVKSQFSFSVNERVFVLFPCGSSTDLYLYPNK